MKLLALSCNRWNFFPLSLSGDKVNGFLKGRAGRAAELARLVPGSWLLIKLWVWIGMVWESGIRGLLVPSLSKEEWKQVMDRLIKAPELWKQTRFTKSREDYTGFLGVYCSSLLPLDLFASQLTNLPWVLDSQDNLQPHQETEEGKEKLCSSAVLF